MVESGTFDAAARRHARSILASCLHKSESAFRRAVAAGLNLPYPAQPSGLDEETAELLATTITSLRERAELSFVDKEDSMTRVCMNMLAHLANRDQYGPWIRSISAC